MKVNTLLTRLFLLTIMVGAAGAMAILFGRSNLSALAPQETYNGQISGSVTGVSTSRHFTVTATGILSNNVTTIASTTTAIPGTGGAYGFSNLAVGDLDFAGYSSIVTYTVSASAPASCYAVSPAARTVYLTSTNPVASGINFTATYNLTPVTLTARITEAVVNPVAIPGTAIIVPPAYSLGTANLITVTFRITSTDSAISQIVTATGSTGMVTFTGLLNTEPIDGSCGRTFGVSVVSVQPLYQGSIGWKYVPASQMQSASLSPASTTAEVGFLAYHYWAFQPIVRRNA
jgi:hypothetical protein